MRRDDEWFGDLIINDKDLDYDPKKEMTSYYSHFYTKYRGLYKKWPYLIMQGLETSEGQQA